MINSSVNKKSHKSCSQCGSLLILVSQETVQLEGTVYTQTNAVYQCSNVACQEKKDKEKADRLKMHQKRVVAEEERMEKIQERRKLNQKLKKQEA